MMLLLLAIGAVFTGSAAGQGTSQQDKMQACNNMADKKGLKSDDRRNFMQSCLSKTADVQNPSEMSEKDK